MFLLILTLIFALLVAIFTIQNVLPVAINFLWFRAEVSLVLVILGSVFAGAIIVYLIVLWREYRRKRKDNYNPSPVIEVKDDDKSK
jgi:putative membrane protein